MTLFGFFSLMGGVGLFLYGMSIMSSGLKNAAGDKMKQILDHATSNRFISVLIGVVLLLISGKNITEIFGSVGVGTIITAFFMGPLITFFNVHVAQPILGKPKERKNVAS